MQHRTLKIALIVFGSCVLLAGIAGQWYQSSRPRLKEHFVFSMSGDGWEAELVLNGQPVARLSGKQAQDFVSQCVVDGENQGRISVRPVSAAPASKTCSARFVRANAGASLSDGKIVKVVDAGKDGAKTVSADFAFEAEVPGRWKWEDANEIASLSDADRSEILAVFGEVARSWQDKDWGRVKGLCLDPSPTWTTLMEIDNLGRTPWSLFMNDAAKASKAPDLAVKTAGVDEVVMVAGPRLIRLCCLDPKQNLFSAEYKPAKSQSLTALSLREMRFARIKGKWRWVM
jgi:hypothetical protein